MALVNPVARPKRLSAGGQRTHCARLSALPDQKLDTLQCVHRSSKPSTSGHGSSFCPAQPRCHHQQPSVLPALGERLKQAGAGALALAVSVALQFGAWQLPAQAVLNSPNAVIARTVDAALRRSIPAFNQDVAKVQKSMEDIAYLLRIPQRKPWSSMAADVTSSLALVSQREALLAGTPAGSREEAEKLLDDIYAGLKKLELAISTQQPDTVSIRVADVLKLVADLELLQAPGLPFALPKDYANLPRLTGRARVEIVVEKADGSLAFVDQRQGGTTSQGTIVLTLDGYSAPISAGNFVANVLDGLYDGRKLQSNYTSLYVPGKPSQPIPPIPLEILPAGEFDPVYRIPLDVQNGELPVLPLSISGAITMAKYPGTDSFLSGEDWFIYKFDKQQAGLAGLAFDEGQFGVFGYVTYGMDVVAKLQSGDVLVSAKVVSGADRLVRPAPPVAAAASQ